MKKGISPVVATALLLVVAVVAVVGFQGWFSTYSSNIYVNTENKASTVSQVTIETVTGNKLYVNSGDGNVSITKVFVDGVDCNINDNISGVESFELNDCLSDTSDHIHEIVVIADSQVVSKKVYLNSPQVTSTSSSSWCYQESADVATVCGGLGTGNYILDELYANLNPIIDGNWSSTLESLMPDAGGYVYVNYTKPTLVLDSSVWQIKDDLGTQNLSLPENCFNQNPIKLRIYFYNDPYILTWACYNQTNWEILSSSSSSVNFPYEEAMWWDIQN